MPEHSLTATIAPHTEASTASRTSPGGGVIPSVDAEIDQASEASFPASDPPPWTSSVATVEGRQ